MQADNAKLVEVDFEQQTVTFKIEGNLGRWGAGEFTIMPRADAERTLASLQDIGWECGCPAGMDITKYLKAMCEKAGATLRTEAA